MLQLRNGRALAASVSLSQGAEVNRTVNIPSQIPLCLSTGSRTVEAIVLVQPEAPNNPLLGTDLQLELGFSLIADVSGKPTNLLTGQEASLNTVEEQKKMDNQQRASAVLGTELSQKNNVQHGAAGEKIKPQITQEGTRTQAMQRRHQPTHTDQETEVTHLTVKGDSPMGVEATEVPQQMSTVQLNRQSFPENDQYRRQPVPSEENSDKTQAPEALGQRSSLPPVQDIHQEDGSPRLAVAAQQGGGQKECATLTSGDKKMVSAAVQTACTVGKVPDQHADSEEEL